jgi:hypothetical protein
MLLPPLTPPLKDSDNPLHISDIDIDVEMSEAISVHHQLKVDINTLNQWKHQVQTSYDSIHFPKQCSQMALAPATPHHISIQTHYISPAPCQAPSLEVTIACGPPQLAPPELDEMLAYSQEVCNRIFFNPMEDVEDRDDGPPNGPDPQDDDAFLDAYASHLP